MFGGGNGDQIQLQGSVAQSELIVAGAGAEAISFGPAVGGPTGPGPADTIYGGSGADNVLLGGASELFAGGGGVAFVEIWAGADTVIGGGGPLSVSDFGTVPSILVGATVGGNQISSWNAASTLIGGGNDDTLTSFFTGNALLIAGPGHEELAADGPSGGHPVFIAGTSNDTLVGQLPLSGGGPAPADTFLFARGHAGGEDLIVHFAGADTVMLSGYSTQDVAAAVANQFLGPKGNINVQLDDGTRIVFYGLKHITAGAFVVT